jgi:hypothetical protein
MLDDMQAQTGPTTLIGWLCPQFLILCPQICPQMPPEYVTLSRTLTDDSPREKAGFQREKEKGRKNLHSFGLVCGARGRNRTGTPCGGGF